MRLTHSVTSHSVKEEAINSTGLEWGFGKDFQEVMWLIWISKKRDAFFWADQEKESIWSRGNSLFGSVEAQNNVPSWVDCIVFRPGLDGGKPPPLGHYPEGNEEFLLDRESFLILFCLSKNCLFILTTFVFNVSVGWFDLMWSSIMLINI